MVAAVSDTDVTRSWSLRPKYGGQLKLRQQQQTEAAAPCIPAHKITEEKQAQRGWQMLRALARKLKFYVLINSLVISFAVQSLLVSRLAGSNVVLGTFFGAVIRMYLSLLWFSSLSLFKERINTRDSSREFSVVVPLAKVFCYVAPIETANMVLASRWQTARPITWRSALLPDESSIIVEFVLFIPKSLVLELIFDLLHYTAHRLCHASPWLYAHVHSAHHKHQYPGPLSTYEQSLPDLVLSNMIPTMVTFLIGPAVTRRQLHLFMAYKTYVEVAGHCGLELKGESFPQMPAVAYISGMCMNVRDHDRHHTKRRINFSKRFILWDVVFNTYSAV